MDWSTMIPDLLKCISDKLPHCLDYFNFRLVCTHWRSAARPKKFPPILILPSASDSAELPFFDPSDGGVHFHPLPESARNKMIRGGSHGWLALMDVPTKSMSLVNPFTGAEFRLPPTPNELLFHFHDCDDSDLDGSLCGDVDGDGICGYWYTEHHYIRDIVMSSAPNSGAECIVVAQEIDGDLLVFCRPGDARWTPIFPSSEIDLSCESHGVAFCDGRFYAVDCLGKLLVLEFGPPDNCVTVIQSFFPPFVSEFYKLLEWNGELLLFGISQNDEAKPLIYKCDDPMEEILTWSKVDSLDGNSIFLSHDHFPSFLGRELHGCKRNCIYLSRTAYIEMMDIADGTSDIISCPWPSNPLEGPDAILPSSGAFFWFRPNFY